MPADSSIFRETSLICMLCNYFSTLYSAYVLTNTVNHVVSLAHQCYPQHCFTLKLLYFISC